MRKLLILTLLLLAPLAIADLKTCLHAMRSLTLSEHTSLLEWLSKETTTNEEILEHLSQDPKLGALLLKSVGVQEGYDLKTHTLKVLDVLKEQESRYDTDKLSPLPVKDLRALLRITLLLHDIGKPEAVEQGAIHLQHEKTIPILEKTLLRLGFPLKEVALAKALVGHDLIGEYLRGHMSVTEAHEKLTEIAENLGLSPQDFFKLQMLYYTSDAASYPTLRQSIFDVRDGKLLPNDPRFRYLAAAFEMDAKAPEDTAPDKLIPLTIETEEINGKPEVVIKGFSGSGILSMKTSLFERTTPDQIATLGQRAKVSYLNGFLLSHRFLITPRESIALRSYVNNGYLEINSHLRGKLANSLPTKARKIIEDDTKALKSLFERVPGLPGALEVFRGSPLLPGQRIPKIGDIIQDKAPQSSSLDRELAEIYTFGVPGLEYPGAKKDRERSKLPPMKVTDLHAHADPEKLPKQGILYIYHLDKGAKLVPFPYFLNYEKAGVVNEHIEGNIKTEDEALLPGGTKWKVFQVDRPTQVKASNAANTVHVVHLRRTE